MGGERRQIRPKSSQTLPSYADIQERSVHNACHGSLLLRGEYKLSRKLKSLRYFGKASPIQLAVLALLYHFEIWGRHSHQSMMMIINHCLAVVATLIALSDAIRSTTAGAPGVEVDLDYSVYGGYYDDVYDLNVWKG